MNRTTYALLLLAALATVVLALALYESRAAEFRACPTYPHEPVVFVRVGERCPAPGEVATT